MSPSPLQRCPTLALVWGLLFSVVRNPENNPSAPEGPICPRGPFPSSGRRGRPPGRGKEIGAPPRKSTFRACSPQPRRDCENPSTWGLLLPQHTDPQGKSSFYLPDPRRSCGKTPILGGLKMGALSAVALRVVLGTETHA